MDPPHWNGINYEPLEYSELYIMLRRQAGDKAGFPARWTKAAHVHEQARLRRRDRCRARARGRGRRRLFGYKKN